MFQIIHVSFVLFNARLAMDQLFNALLVQIILIFWMLIV